MGDPSVSFSVTQGPGVNFQVIPGSQLTQVQAGLTTGQSIASGGYQVLTGWTVTTNASPAFGSLEDPTYGAFVGTTGVYTAVTNVDLLFNAAVELAAASGGAVGTEFSIAVFVNGAVALEFAYQNPVATLATKRMLALSGTLLLHQGDVADIRVAQASGAPIALTNAATRNRLSISSVTRG